MCVQLHWPRRRKAFPCCIQRTINRTITWETCHNDAPLCLADLLNVFETFLPQLLAYPNPADPLNGEAAALLMREPEKYKTRVRGMSIL
jgi:hypothetical protein